MNSGLWISFSLSTGRCWRWTVPLAVAAQTPLARFWRGRLDIAPKQLPSPTTLIP